MRLDLSASITKASSAVMGGWDTAPVSHQKQFRQGTPNAIEIERKRSKINEADRYSAAHNGLIAGSWRTKASSAAQGNSS
jgi:hypothetical protein